jgi:hypothetical protein
MNIVAVTPDRDNYINPLKNHLSLPLVYLRTYNWDDLYNLKPALVIFLSDWIYDQYVLVKKCKENKIPTVMMMDGTIEWKHFFENPKWSLGGNEAPYFPTYCDKIFVPGHSTFRFLEFFGNKGKCEITGLPRFDHYHLIEKKSKVNLKKVIGVMSANTAGYTKEQIDSSIKFFEDIYYWSKNQKEFEIIFRLRKGFSDLLNVKIENDDSSNLLNFLEKTDAIIGQPSTAAYESMLLGIPTALADYSIAPNYMESVWRISSKEQIESVASEIVKPSKIKFLLQQQYLADTLSFVGNSAQVCAQILNGMIDSTNSKVELNSFSELPSNKIEFLNAVNFVDFPKPIFPNRTNYQFTDFEILEEEFIKLKVKNNELLKALKRRGLGFWFELLINKIIK